jgi:NADH-quinone oxidoreductase subunit H
MREAAQVVSYEVPIGLCVILPVMICGTMNLVTIAEMQSGLFTNWLIFHDPFTFLVFWVFFACGLASVNRAPFDLAEAESELVAGFHTEYSGLRWSIFFMAEYGSMFLVGGLATILFFGGWNGPIPIFDWLGWSYAPDETGVRLTGYLANLAGCTNFIVKSIIAVSVMMWVRWTLPRLRIDQVVVMCWKYCVPIAALCFLGLCAWQFWSLPSANDWAAPQMRGEVREPWAQQTVSDPGQQVGRSDRGGEQVRQSSKTVGNPLRAADESLGQADSKLAGRAG